MFEFSCDTQLSIRENRELPIKALIMIMKGAFLCFWRINASWGCD